MGLYKQKKFRSLFLFIAVIGNLTNWDAQANHLEKVRSTRLAFQESEVPLPENLHLNRAWSCDYITAEQRDHTNYPHSDRFFFIEFQGALQSVSAHFPFLRFQYNEARTLHSIREPGDSSTYYPRIASNSTLIVEETALPDSFGFSANQYPTAISNSDELAKGYYYCNVQTLPSIPRPTAMASLESSTSQPEKKRTYSAIELENIQPVVAQGNQPHLYNVSASNEEEFEEEVLESGYFPTTGSHVGQLSDFEDEIEVLEEGAVQFLRLISNASPSFIQSSKPIPTTTSSSSSSSAAPSSTSIYSERARELKEIVQTLPVVEVTQLPTPLTQRGQFPDINDPLIQRNIIKESAIIRIKGSTSPDGVVAYFIKGALPREKVALWTRLFTVIPSSNDQRFQAAGPIDMNRLSGVGPFRQTSPFTVVALDKDGNSRGFNKSNTLMSSSLGFGVKKGVLQLTATTYDFHQLYVRSVIPFFEEISAYFEQVAPEWYQDHVQILQRSKMNVGSSVFTTGTFNLGVPNSGGKFTDSQTACHTDTNHSNGGAEVFAVLGQDIRGGELIFPEYGFALQIEEGDLIVMKGRRDLHGNAPLLGGTKLSAILHIHKCHEKREYTQEEMIPFKRDYDPVGESFKVGTSDQGNSYACPISSECNGGKAFSTGANLKRHVRQVHHACMDCSLQFKTIHDVEVHKTNHHPTTSKPRTKKSRTSYLTGPHALSKKKI